MKIDINTIKSIYLTVYFNNTVLANATGFLVNYKEEIYLITNRHVVTGRNNETGECLNSKLSIPNKLGVCLPYKIYNSICWKQFVLELIDEDDNIKWIEHPKYKGKVDVIALKLKDYGEREFCYNLMTNYVVNITSQVFIIGYPYGLNINPHIGKFGIWTSGSVASEPILDLNIKGEQLPVFLVDSKTREGQSGSPVIYYNLNGIDYERNGISIYSGTVIHEVGIYSGRINKDSDLGYVWKWSLIKEIIENDK